MIGNYLLQPEAYCPCYVEKLQAVERPRLHYQERWCCGFQELEESVLKSPVEQSLCQCVTMECFRV